MNRKTLFAGAIFVGLVLVAIGLLRSPERAPAPGERPRPIPRLKAGDFDTLEITKAGATTVIKKKGDDYQIVKPVDYLAERTPPRLPSRPSRRLSSTTSSRPRRAGTMSSRLVTMACAWR